MFGISRRRSDRPGSARPRPGSALERLEERALLSTSTTTFNPYRPSFLLPRTIDHQTATIRLNGGSTSSDAQLANLDNAGRVITGKNRQGDEYQITVHGPGYVIVTDATPNDGVLDDDIDTIQVVGSNPNTTYVTGQTNASARLVTDGTVYFNRLVSENGVKSIILNGFTLARTVFPNQTPGFNSGNEIDLPNGVGYLSFHDIQAPIDTAIGAGPIDIVIGRADSPLTTKPTIKLDRIFNTVFNSSVNVNANGNPQTTPTVNIIVNGDIHGLEFISSTNVPVGQDPVFYPRPAQGIQGGVTGGESYRFPVVGTTGRTAIRANAIDRVTVQASAKNTTFSRSATPFQNGTTGLRRLGHAAFGGTADAVGIDVDGPVDGVTFAKGLGDPTGTSVAQTALGTPDPQRSYSSFGLLGGKVTATRIRRLRAGQANQVLLTGQDPDFIQLSRQGSTQYYAADGNALTNAAITAQGSIDTVQIAGNAQASEIKTGFDNTSYVKGLEGTRAASRIARYHQRGDLVDGVISATYRPTDGTYDEPDETTGAADNDVAGPGSIAGNLTGRRFSAARETALNQFGSGVYAARKVGRNLPPPDAPLADPSAVTVPAGVTVGGSAIRGVRRSVR